MIIVGLDVGLKNLAMCKIRRDSNNVIEDILGWELIDCIDGGNAKKISIEDGCRAVIQTLDSMRSFFDDVEVFSIEAQPCGRIATSNIKMKVISHCIQTWAMLRKPDMKVIFVNPKTKICREYCGELLELEGGDSAVKKRYKKHKQMATDACTAIVEKFEKWKEFFYQHKKKDDISDALLIAAVSERKKPRKRKRRAKNKGEEVDAKEKE